MPNTQETPFELTLMLFLIVNPLCADTAPDARAVEIKFFVYWREHTVWWGNQASKPRLPPTVLRAVIAQDRGSSDLACGRGSFRGGTPELSYWPLENQGGG